MNKEDEKLIAEYMCWQEDELLVGYCVTEYRTAHFDLNDAGLVVKEMLKRGDWEGFVAFVEETPENRESLITWNQLIAWLFSADNFHVAMAEWLRSTHNG